MEKEEGNEPNTKPGVTPQREVWTHLEGIEDQKTEEEYLALAEARNLFDVDELLETAINPRKFLCLNWVRKASTFSGVPLTRLTELT